MTSLYFYFLTAALQFLSFERKKNPSWSQTATNVISRLSDSYEHVTLWMEMHCSTFAVIIAFTDAVLVFWVALYKSGFLFFCFMIVCNDFSLLLFFTDGFPTALLKTE